MRKTIHLYWQETCASAIPDVGKALTDNLPLTVLPSGVLEPAPEAFDTWRRRYDAEYLLRGLAAVHNAVAGESLALWVISGDISCAGYDYVYGAAVKDMAVVSAARAGSGENLLKEACHEAGHLLGLEHCENPCLMNTSPDLKRLAAKPMKFCAECADLVRCTTGIKERKRGNCDETDA